MGPLRIEHETWGERFHRAYRKGRDAYGFTWRSLAETISQVTPVVNSTLIRMSELEEAPAGRAKRQLAYLTVLAMGFDPDDFDLTEEDVSPGWHMPTVRRLLTPKSRRNVATRRCITAPAGLCVEPRLFATAA